MSLITEVRDIVASRELLGNLVRRELRSKYKGTVLGWTWSLINPLATTLIFTVVFSVIMRVEPPTGVDGLVNYPLFLLTGLLSWNFVVAAVQGGQSVILANDNLIKKTYFPRRLLVLAHVGSSFVSYLIEMAVLMVIYLVLGINVLPWIPLVLVLMALLAVFALGIALALSVANVYFRDVAHFVGLWMQIWFYASPIIYPLTLVTGLEGGTTWAADLPIEEIYRLNPIVGFVESLRDMLYEGHLPSLGAVLFVLGVTAVTLVGGNLVFRRLEGRLAEEL